MVTYVTASLVMPRFYLEVLDLSISFLFLGISFFSAYDEKRRITDRLERLLETKRGRCRMRRPLQQAFPVARAKRGQGKARAFIDNHYRESGLHFSHYF